MNYIYDFDLNTEFSFGGNSSIQNLQKTNKI